MLKLHILLILTLIVILCLIDYILRILPKEVSTIRNQVLIWTLKNQDQELWAIIAHPCASALIEGDISDRVDI